MNIYLLLPAIFVLTVGVILPSANCVVQQDGIPGGLTGDRAATLEVKQLVQGIHLAIKSHLLGLPGGRNIRGEIQPISFRTQLVNGVNYFIKVQARTQKKVVFYHLKIYKSFGGQVQLVNVEGPKRQHENINFF